MSCVSATSSAQTISIDRSDAIELARRAELYNTCEAELRLATATQARLADSLLTARRQTTAALKVAARQKKRHQDMVYFALGVFIALGGCVWLLYRNLATIRIR